MQQPTEHNKTPAAFLRFMGALAGNLCSEASTLRANYGTHAFVQADVLDAIGEAIAVTVEESQNGD